MKNTFKKISTLCMILGITSVMLYGCGHGGSGDGGQNVLPTPTPAQKSGVYIDVSAQIPLPNGNSVHTGTYVTNYTNHVATNLKFSIKNSGASKSEQQSTFKSISSWALKKMGIDDNSLNGSGIVLDANPQCANIPANSTCLVTFTVLSVNKGDSGSATLEMIGDNGLYSEQILSWYDYGDPGLRPSGVNFSNGTFDVLQNMNMTAYLIGTGSAGTVNKNISLVMNPKNSLKVLNGLTPTTEIASYQVVPIQVGSASFGNQRVGAKMTPYSGLLGGTPLSFGILPTQSPNLIFGNLPIMEAPTPLESAIVVNIFNNGTQGITDLQISPSDNTKLSIDGATNTCSSVLAANSGCSFKLYIPTTQTVTDATINYSYNGKVLTQAVKAYNMTLSGDTPFLSVIPDITGLLELNANESQKIAYTITNISNKPINLAGNVSLGKNGAVSFVLESAGNGCDKVLNKNDACIVTTRLTAGANEELGGVFVLASIDSYRFKGGTEYHVMPGGPLLEVTPTLQQMTIPGNGWSFESQQISITNNGTESVQLSAIKLVSNSLVKSSNLKGIASVVASDSYIDIDDGTCATYFTNKLGVGESCIINLTLKPQVESQAVTINGSHDVVVEYLRNKSAVSVPTHIYWTILPMDTSLKITNVVAENFDTGSGVSADQYITYGSNPNAPKVTITYQNASTVLAMTNMALDTSTLSPLWQVDSGTTCGYGAQVMAILESSQTCDLVLTMDRKYASFDSNTNGLVNLNINYLGGSWNVAGGLAVQSGITDSNNNATLYFDYQNAVLTSAFNVTMGTHFESATLTQTLTQAGSYPTFQVTTANLGMVNGADISNNCTLSGINVVCSMGSSSNVSTINYVVPRWATPPVVEPLFFNLTGPATSGYQYTVYLNPSYYIFDLE